jgi:phthiocerol/phenolphthiocerol synthesis type-I polyketide synthase E
LRFLDNGLSQPGRWRVPLVLRLDSRVSAQDATAVLTAIINHHDALRMRIVDRAGMWEQQIAEPSEFTDLTEVALPAEAVPGAPQEREALHAIISAAVEQDLGSAPLTASTTVGPMPGSHKRPTRVALASSGREVLRRLCRDGVTVMVRVGLVVKKSL